MLLRSWVSCDTLRPRYSVRTAALDVRNLSEISATVAALSGLAMALLPCSSSRSAPRHDERPGAGARGVRNGCGNAHPRALSRVVPGAGPDGDGSPLHTCAGRPLLRDLRPPSRVVTGGLWLTTRV